MLEAVQVLLILVLILYFAFIASKYVGKMGRIKGSRGLIKIIDQVAVSQDKAIAVVKIDETYLLVGISSTQITLLKELDSLNLGDYFDLNLNETNSPQFKSIFDKIRKKDGE